MNGFKAIIEGNSVLTFQWRSISLHYLWHLADWVEEIHYISSMTIFSFFSCFSWKLISQLMYQLKMVPLAPIQCLLYKQQQCGFLFNKTSTIFKKKKMVSTIGKRWVNGPRYYNNYAQQYNKIFMRHMPTYTWKLNTMGNTSMLMSSKNGTNMKYHQQEEPHKKARYPFFIYKRKVQSHHSKQLAKKLTSNTVSNSKLQQLLCTQANRFSICSTVC